MARLARGGMAEIVLARLGGTGGFEKLVVLKRLLPHLASKERLVSMFLHEACVAARISHPNVCQVLELGEAAGHYNIVMEYLEGAIVGQIALALPASRGRFEVRLLAEVFRQLCAGLHHAHESRTADGRPAGLVHRDVSPQNLLVTFDGVAKVLDFGIAKSSRSLNQTRAGVALGKAGYMSPEQVRCEPLDRRTDVFSLGVVLHEALTGQSLFHRDTSAETCRAVLACRVPDVRDVQWSVPAALADAVHAALAPRPDDRPATAAELGALLAASVASIGGPLHTSELAAWMTEAFGDAIDDRRRRVAAALAAQARRTDDVEPTEPELATLPAVAHATTTPDGVTPTGARVTPRAEAKLPAVGLYPGRVLFAAPGQGWSRAAAFVTRGGHPEPYTQDVSRPQTGARAMSAWVGHLPLLAPLTPPPPEDALAVAAVPDDTAPALDPDLATAAHAASPGPRWPRRLSSLAAQTRGWLAPRSRRALLGTALTVLAAALGLVAVERSRAAPASSAATAPPGPDRVSGPGAGMPGDAVTMAAPITPPSITATPVSAAPITAAPSEPRPGPTRRATVRTAARAVRPARTGWLTIDSHPYGAVYVDGKRAGLTPLVRAPVAAGVHRVTVKLGDGRVRHLRIVVEAGREAPRQRIDW